MVNAALAGELESASFERDAIFGVDVPTAVSGVPAEVLVPRLAWADPAAYEAQARKLAQMFVKNFAQFEDGVSTEVKAAAPVA
jgi:phosphoenolpyruvate carboxykinase (ATP)